MSKVQELENLIIDHILTFREKFKKVKNIIKEQQNLFIMVGMIYDAEVLDHKNQ